MPHILCQKTLFYHLLTGLWLMTMIPLGQQIYLVDVSLDWKYYILVCITCAPVSWMHLIYRAKPLLRQRKLQNGNGRRHVMELLHGRSHLCLSFPRYCTLFHVWSTFLHFLYKPAKLSTCQALSCRRSKERFQRSVMYVCSFFIYRSPKASTILTCSTSEACGTHLFHLSGRSSEKWMFLTKFRTVREFKYRQTCSAAFMPWQSHSLIDSNI